MGGKPWQDRERIETHYLTARNHVTLDPQTCSAVETALFEVESIAARTLHGSERGQPARLAGGLWHSTPQLAGRALKDWFHRGLLLGGELKIGLGRVKLAKPGRSCRAAMKPAWIAGREPMPRLTDFHGLRCYGLDCTLYSPQSLTLRSYYGGVLRGVTGHALFFGNCVYPELRSDVVTHTASSRTPRF